MKIKRSTRRPIQIAFFLLIGAIAVNKALAETGAGIPFLSTASLHALCPFGGVVTLYNLATVGTFVQKIHSSAVVLMGIVFVLAILFGPVFCGWVCPLGSVQEWIGRLGKKVFGRRYGRILPARVSRVLSWFRYVVLAGVVYATARGGILVFADIDPYNALFTFWSEEVAVPALAILGVTLAGSLFIERPWCRFACPYGALLGLFNKIRIFKIRRVPSTCIDCGSCDRACPMGLDISHGEVVSDPLCISCMECTSERKCPVPATVEFAAGRRNGAARAGIEAAGPGNEAIRPGRRWRIRGPLLAGLILGIFFTGIATTMALGVWSSTSEKEPARFAEGSAAGEYDPSDIRGSYTFQDVSDLFGIPVAVLYEAFGLSDSLDPAATRTNALEELYGELTGPAGPVEIGNGSVQVFVALYKGLPVSLTDTWLPAPAVDLLLAANPDLTPEQRAYLAEHRVELPAIQTEQSGEDPAPSVDPGTGDPSGPELSLPDLPATELPTEEKPPVNGNTTFQQVLDAGLTNAQLQDIFGPDLPPGNMKIKDYCTEAGLSFSTVKTQLTELLAAIS